MRFNSALTAKPLFCLPACYIKVCPRPAVTIGFVLIKDFQIKKGRYTVFLNSKSANQPACLTRINIHDLAHCEIPYISTL